MTRREPPAPSPDDSLLAAERTLVAALCQGAASPAVCARIRRALAAHRFLAPENELVFRAVAALAAALGEPSARELRAHLPAELVRRGFPDTELELFFSAACPAEDDLLALAERLERARR